MLVTNLQRLPEPLYRAVAKIRPRREDQISVTELIQPPQMRALINEYWEQLEEDAADRIWAAVGTLMHKVLEENAAHLDDHLSEQFLETEVLGWRVTGTADLYHTDGTLTDYKFVSVWTTIDGIKTEWVCQLNLYAELFRRSGLEVNKLQIVAMFRDWSKSRANDSGYPQSQVRVFDVPLWPEHEASEFLEDRVRLHQRALEGEYPECTAKERWERPTQYAIMKVGRKSAVRLYDDEQVAKDALTMLAPNHRIEERIGKSVRCESYCSVSRFCKTYQRIKADANA